jgi:hypothetical protein
MSTEMTPAQLDAARANCAKSTGPITPAGKSKAAQNARKHGLSAAHVVLPDESQTDYKFLLNGYIERFQPQNTVEFELVTTMAVARWRFRRLVNIEPGVLNHDIVTRQREMDTYRTGMTSDDRLAWVFRRLTDNSQSISMVVRYEGTLTRTHDRAFRQLDALRSPKKSPTTKQSQAFPPDAPATPPASSI